MKQRVVQSYNLEPPDQTNVPMQLANNCCKIRELKTLIVYVARETRLHQAGKNYPVLFEDDRGR